MFDAFVRGLRRLTDELHNEVSLVADDAVESGLSDLKRDVLDPFEQRLDAIEERLIELSRPSAEA